MITRRDLVAAITAASITLACVSVAQQPGGLLDSTAWKWPDLQAKETDVGELRVKESDRIQRIVALLRDFGVEVEEKPEGFRVEGKPEGQLRAAP